MKSVPMIDLANALNVRERTTDAFSYLVDLIEHAYRSDSMDTGSKGSARADLLELFVDKMRASDKLCDELLNEIRNSNR